MAASALADAETIERAGRALIEATTAPTKVIALDRALGVTPTIEATSTSW
jgi:hypothetical protein